MLFDCCTHNNVVIVSSTIAQQNIDFLEIPEDFNAFACVLKLVSYYKFLLPNLAHSVYLSLNSFFHMAQQYLGESQFTLMIAEKKLWSPSYVDAAK